MLKTLRRKVDNAEKKLNEANCAVAAIYPLLKFEGFNGDDLPGIDHCAGGLEIFLEYRGFEIEIKEAIFLMEKNGVITPQDFNLFLD